MLITGAGLTAERTSDIKRNYGNTAWVCPYACYDYKRDTDDERKQFIQKTFVILQNMDKYDFYNLIYICYGTGSFGP